MIDKLKTMLKDNYIAIIGAGIVAATAVVGIISFVVTDIMGRLLDSSVERVSGGDWEGYLTQIVLAAVLLVVASYWYTQRRAK